MIVALPPRSAAPVGAAVLLCLALAASSCAGGDSPEVTSDPGASGGTERDTDAGTAVDAGAGGSCPDASGALADFGVDRIVVRPAGGDELERCILVADRPALRQRGLMHVEDLGAYDGMVFAYPADSDDGYWMRDTPMPLTIAWVGADGEVVSVADMEPCLDGARGCPVHEPAGPFRWAVEVPQGELGAFGLTDGGSVDPASMPTAEH